MPGQAFSVGRFNVGNRPQPSEPSGARVRRPRPPVHCTPAEVGHALPVQLITPRPDTGPRALLRAILESAIRDARDRRLRPERVAEAQAWLESDSPRPWGAVWVTLHLNVDLEDVRRRVHQPRRPRAPQQIKATNPDTSIPSTLEADERRTA